MVGIHQMRQHTAVRRLHFLASIALGAGSWFNLAIATPTLSQTPKVPAASQTPQNGSRNTTPTRSLLKTGSQGTEVAELQGILKLLGYYTGSINASFDPPTAIAVGNFQKAAGLPADSIVGSETWNRLLPPSPTVAAAASKPDSFPIPSSQSTPVNSTKQPIAAATPAKSAATKPTPSNEATQPESITLPILRIGMQGSAVTGLQERLKALGFLKSSADGVFGAETQAAVKAAQSKLSLTPDGVVGTVTWLALMR